MSSSDTTFSANTLSSTGLANLVQQNSISAGPLPDAQSFSFLKQQGINLLQQLAGSVWSNYNDSDPGVTILEQVLYALTELGYVNDFSIEDVLTQPDGDTRYWDQFFKPETILTTAPVTIDDYRRLAIEHFAAIDNLYITPQMKGLTRIAKSGGVQLDQDVANESFNTGLYQVEIYSRRLMSANTTTAGGNNYSRLELAGEVQTPNEQRANLAALVQKFLNSQRNLGEFFITPIVLIEQNISLSGKVMLTPDADISDIYKAIDSALEDYVSPLIQQTGYRTARKAGATADEIFNGPQLKDGWITDDAGLGEKRTVVSLVEVITILSDIEGIMALDSIRFSSDTASDSSNANSSGDSDNTINITEGCVAHILLGDDFKLIKSKTPHSKTLWQQQMSELNQLSNQLEASSVDAKIEIAPPLPQGQYRQIEDYYSVQYTFPEIYGIGNNALQSDASDFRVAQARQLKGYLYLFDQVVANQLSQLANVNNLFSFSYSRVASNESQYHAELNLQMKIRNGTATPTIPIQGITRTYFYQPLYQVPGASSLLKGPNSYEYFYPGDPTDAKHRELIAWQRFQDDPFNRYFYGLNAAMEKSEEAEQRRDEMLSHLLARHGESADLYNDIIDGSLWYGGLYKTRILVKTQWLQNLQGLSYNRNQAIDFTDSSAISEPLNFADAQKQLQKHSLPNSTDNPFDFENNGDLLDGIFDAAALDKYAKISSQGFKDQATFSLKADMLLGFRQHLFSLASALVRLLQTQEFSSWLASALQNKTATEFPTSQQIQDNPTLKEQLEDTSASYSLEPIKSSLEPAEGASGQSKSATDTQSQACLLVFVGSQEVLRIPTNSEGFSAESLKDYATQLLWLAQNQGWMLIEHSLLQSGITESTPGKVPTSVRVDPTVQWCWLQASMVFPSYVSLTQQQQFQYFLSVIEQLHWPTHIQLHLRQGDFAQMQTLIQQYCQWYSAMQQFSGNYRHQSTTVDSRSEQSSTEQSSTEQSSTEQSSSEPASTSSDTDVVKVLRSAQTALQTTMQKQLSDLTYDSADADLANNSATLPTSSGTRNALSFIEHTDSVNTTDSTSSEPPQTPGGSEHDS